MRGEKNQSHWERVLELARKQHGAVARRQLIALGLTAKAIEWALRAGRLHRTEWRGVYVVGRPELTRYGRWRAAMLARSDHAVLMGPTAGELWRIWKPRDRDIHLSVPLSGRRRKVAGVVVHRRSLPRKDLTRERGIPVTTPLRTVIDLAAGADRDQAERLVNAVDARNLLRADTLRQRLDHHRGEPGVRLLVALLDRDAFVLTDSELERLYLPLAERAGLPKPHSQHRLGPHRVDFFYAELNLVVECDSLRYHRTTLQQRADRERDHAHLLADRNRERVLFDQIAHDPEHVVAVLTRVRLRSAASSSLAAASGS